MARIDIIGLSLEQPSQQACGPPQRQQRHPTVTFCPGRNSFASSTNTAPGSRMLQRSPHKLRRSPSGSLQTPWTRTSLDQSQMANSGLRPSACCSPNASRKRQRAMKHSRSSRAPARTYVYLHSSLCTHSVSSVASFRPRLLRVRIRRAIRVSRLPFQSICNL